MFTILFLFIFLLSGCDAVIYRLTDEQYARMPPVYYEDSYNSCKTDTESSYCISDYVLVSDKPSSLLDMIQQYSVHEVTHFNHSKIRSGICITKTCKEFYNNENRDPSFALEACFNKTMSEKYDLKVKLMESPKCRNPSKDAKSTDGLDIAVGIICISLIVLAIVGSFVDYFNKKEQKNRALRLLICSSLYHNWKILTNTAENPKGRLVHLKSLDGVRVISNILVIIIHGFMALTVIPATPHTVEKMYSSTHFMIVSNSSAIITTFFVMSAFLLVYHLLLRSENEQISWLQLRKRIFLRWLRITPPYAMALAVTTTWFAHLRSGPLWINAVEVELIACRQYWWQHLLYANNYLNISHCMLHSWYLAADIQLYCLAVIFFGVCRSPLSRKIGLSLLFVSGIIIPAAHIYFQDLESLLLLSPEKIFHVFTKDSYFKYVYVPSHTNIIGTAVGISMAYLVYQWQKNKVDIRQYQKPIYQILYKSIIFLIIGCCSSGVIFYNEGPRQPLYVRVLYGALLKGIYAVLFAVFIVGCIFKFEDGYRSFLEWRGWKVLSHLTYSSYLMHEGIVKTYVGSMETLLELNVLTAVQFCGIILIRSAIATLVFWLLVEAPINNVIDEFTSKPKMAVKKKEK